MLKFIGKNQFMMANIPSDINKNNIALDEENKREFEIEYHFSNFNRPSLIDNELNIFVDNSYEVLSDDYVLFIDHHQVEQSILYKTTNDQYVIDNYKEFCVSNANLMYNIYEDIVDVVKKLKFNKVNVYMHTDLDGIASGLIMRQILEDVKNNSISKEKNILSMILGNYGDVYPDAKYGLADLFNSVPEDIVVFDKKLKIIVKQIGRFMKATRPILDSILDKKSVDLKEEEHIKKSLLKNNIQLDDLKYVIQELIFTYIENMKNADTANVITFINSFMSNDVFKAVNEEFQNIIDMSVKEYLEPTYPLIELTAIFKKDKENTEFKILFIDNIFDCGRSVIWKYRYSYKQLLRNSVINSKWKYKLTDWKNKNHNKLMKNIACYNRRLNKLTLDGDNNSSFEIATSYSKPGGGHLGTTSDGKGSIGSVIVSEEEFMNSLVIKEFF